MKVAVVKKPCGDIEADALVWPVYQEPEKLPRQMVGLGEDVAQAAGLARDAGDFTGKLSSVWTVHPRQAGCRRLLLVGLGAKMDADLEAVRRAFGKAAYRLSRKKVERCAVVLPKIARAKPGAVAEAAVTGLRLGAYHFTEYLTADADGHRIPIEELTIAVDDAKQRRAVEQGAARGLVVSEATARVRDLVNMPANDLYPESYAKIAVDWCREANVKVDVMTPAQIKKQKMHAVMAVGGGSDRGPRFLILEYRGNRRKKGVDVVLVGKGVTFDTGGISLKPVQGMWEMRGDMMGSAVVLSTTMAAAKLKLPVNLITLMPLVENMPSARAYRPGDVVRTMSGLTVEIMSTDAEGRMILADALTYAQRFDAGAVVDVATLTGAIEVALGKVRAGLFGNDDKLQRRLEAASGASGEPVWRMPYDAAYGDSIKSVVADTKNSGGRPGGSSVAARFLGRFVGDSRWAHIDIANMDLDDNGSDFTPKGPTGFGARLLIEFLSATAGR